MVTIILHINIADSKYIYRVVLAIYYSAGGSYAFNLSCLNNFRFADRYLDNMLAELSVINLIAQLLRALIKVDE